MKKLLLLFISTLLFSGVFATSESVIKPVLNAKNIYLPVGKTGQKISLMELSQISLRDFETLTNRKMKFFDRLAFKAGQRKLQKNIATDGTVKKKLDRILNKYFAGGSGFHAGGFFLGLLLGLIGVLIAYLIRDDKKRNRVKWAWIGWGAWVAILLIFIVAGSGHSVY